MTLPNILIGVCLTSFAPDPDVDAVRFEQLIRGLYGSIHDITLACEGEIRAGDSTRAAGRDKDFQCRYRYRSDGAASLDLYQQGLNADDRRSHSLFQNLGGVSSLQAVPDRGKLTYTPAAKAPTASRPRRPAPLIRSGCPERILFLWYFQGLSDARSMHYDFQGWENVDGQQCLRVELDFQEGALPEQGNRMRFWIDMNRGGHPLRVEQFRRGLLAWRCDHITLTQFSDAKGTAIWLPVSGRVETFLGTTVKEKKRVIVRHEEPVFVETYSVITSSVLLNQRLSNDQLRMSRDAANYSEFKEFKAIQTRRGPSIQTDPKDVQKRLDEALADADNQAKRLEASTPERYSWDLMRVSSLGLPVLGVALLGLAGAWWLRGR